MGRIKRKLMTWFTVCLLAAVSVGMLAGCSGGGADSPEGALKATIQGLKSGDMQKVADLVGADLSKNEGKNIAKIYQAMLRKTDVSIGEVEMDGSGTAHVTVTGKAGDLVTFMNEAHDDMREKLKEWAAKNAEKAASMSQETLQKEACQMLASLFESGADDIPTTKVDAVVTMVKDGETWKVSDQDELSKAVFGSSTTDVYSSLENLFLAAGTQK